MMSSSTVPTISIKIDTTELRIPIKELETHQKWYCHLPLINDVAPPGRAMVSSMMKPMALHDDIISDDEYYTFCTTINKYIQSYDKLLARRKEIVCASSLIVTSFFLAGFYIGQVLFTDVNNTTSILYSLWVYLRTGIVMAHMFLLAAIISGRSKTYIQKSVGAEQVKLYDAILVECLEMSHRCCVASSLTKSSSRNDVIFAVLSSQKEDFAGKFHYLDDIQVTIKTYTHGKNTKGIAIKTTTTTDEGVTTTTTTMSSCTDDAAGKMEDRIKHRNENVESHYLEIV